MTGDTEQAPLFDWTNKEWSERWLPVVRLASLTLQPDRRDAIAGMNETEAGDLAEWFVDAAAHLKALADLCEAGAHRVVETWDAAHQESA